MRIKHVCAYIPLPAYTKLFWERVTFSRLTVIYLVFSVLHFLIQLALQIRAFTINAAAFNSALSLVGQRSDVLSGLPFYHNSTLRICEWVPSNLNLNSGSCRVIWPTDKSNNAPSQQDNAPYLIPGSPSSVFLEQTLVGAPSEVLKAPPSSISLSSPIASSSPIALSSPSSVPAVLESNPAGTVVQTVQPTSTVVPARLPIPPIVSASSIRPAPPAAGISSSSASGQVASSTLSLGVPIASTTDLRAPPTVTVVVIPSTAQTVETVVATPIPTALNNAGTGGVRLPDDSDEDSDNNVVEDSGAGSREDHNDDVHIQLLGRDDSENSAIPDVCLDAWSYPLSILGNTKREDIVFMAFQFWVLGMSVVALLNESIPHIFASLVTHIIATAWGGFQLVNTANFRSEFNALITKGACRGVNASPIAASYWEARKAAEIPSMALNVLALLVSCFLTWRLIKLFGWQTFKRVGASLVINRMYKLVLILSITIQLSLFFMAVTVSLWLDRLVNNVIGDLADLRKVYMAASILTLVLLVPWLMMGWFGVRRELKLSMFIFLGLGVLYLGGWSTMLVSTTFRWTFVTWMFFSVMASASVLLTVASLVLGLLCRLNFGKGLLRYLSAQEALPGNDFGIVTPEQDMEKVQFPSTEKPVPTFDATYGSKVPGGGPFISNGPRFFNQPLPPMRMAFPPRALTRTASDRSTQSYSSEKSASSWDSYYTYSHSRDNSLQHGQSKRWVIE